jgi:hypothetical protein
MLKQRSIVLDFILLLIGASSTRSSSFRDFSSSSFSLEESLSLLKDFFTAAQQTLFQFAPSSLLRLIITLAMVALLLHCTQFCSRRRTKSIRVSLSLSLSLSLWSRAEKKHSEKQRTRYTPGTEKRHKYLQIDAPLVHLPMR